MRRPRALPQRLLLLTRSSDFSTYATILYPAYPNELQRPLLLALIQMLWDRSDPDGYAHHMTTDPLPNTPAHEVLLHEAFGDHQVANVATEIEARTIGASIHQPAIASGRSYEVTPYYGIPAIPSYPFDGSALIVWDSGADTPPTTNTAPSTGPDPHGDPRSSPDARTQKSEFLKVGGAVVDVCSGMPCVAPKRARSVTRDCRARERGHRLRFDSAPLDTGQGATDPFGAS